MAQCEGDPFFKNKANQNFTEEGNFCSSPYDGRDVSTPGGGGSTTGGDGNAVVACNGNFAFAGSQGIYELVINFGSSIGQVGLELESFDIPDRFQIVWDGQVVADSLYIGDSLESYTEDLIGSHNLDRFNLDSSGEIQKIGNENLTVLNSELASTSLTRADGSSLGQINVDPTHPSPSAPTSDGNVILSFGKIKANPSTAKLVIYAPLGDTAWDLVSVICARLEGEQRFRSGESVILAKNFASLSLDYHSNSVVKDNHAFVNILPFRPDNADKNSKPFRGILHTDSGSVSKLSSSFTGILYTDSDRENKSSTPFTGILYADQGRIFIKHNGFSNILSINSNLKNINSHNLN